MPFQFSAPLYPIADTLDRTDRTYVELTEAILSAGVGLVQLRVKKASTRAFVEFARAVKASTDRRGAQLIINDRPDIARLVDAAGVHLGQDDLPPVAAREILGPGKILGFSTHSAAQTEAAVRAGFANYLAFGPIFATESKERPDPEQGLQGLRQARRLCPLPLVAIGGVCGANMDAVFRSGADAVALIGAITRADDPGAATRSLLARAERMRNTER